VIASNRINDPLKRNELFAMGLADMVNMGRALLADPDLPNKARAGLERKSEGASPVARLLRSKVFRAGCLLYDKL
jgi:2,4-dienoyl-CoA reductase-like NADH-dependent reductase (Old Yellow Enzyme family)